MIYPIRCSLDEEDHCRMGSDFHQSKSAGQIPSRLHLKAAIKHTTPPWFSCPVELSLTERLQDGGMVFYYTQLSCGRFESNGKEKEQQRARETARGWKTGIERG